MAVIKLRRGYLGGPRPRMTGVSEKRKFGRRGTHGEIAMPCEGHGDVAPSRGAAGSWERGLEQSLPRDVGGSVVLWAPWSVPSGLENCGRPQQLLAANGVISTLILQIDDRLRHGETGHLAQGHLS